ncbi:MAG: carboxypeptidase M32 [Candidatus Heimdallarchaeota archaeon]
MKETSYVQLMKKFKDIAILESLRGILFWDLNTGMPPNGLEFRSEQSAWLQQQLHKRWTHPKFLELVSACEKNGNLDPVQKRNIVLCRREVENRISLPLDLVQELAKQANLTQEIWKRAKKINSFKKVKPALARLFELNLKRASLIADNKNINDPYNALIGLRDPGLTTDFLTSLFDVAKSTSISLIKKIGNSRQNEGQILAREVPLSAQKAIIHDLSKVLGYSRENGRIDEVEHPITFGCGPQDVRVTVKYHKTHVFKAISAFMHECGHAIHGLQKNPEWFHQPVNLIGYPSISESQSRFFENIIGLSHEFWSFYYPRFQKLTERIFNDVALDEFYSAINTIKPGKIRIEADELTYLLHIVIRFELERDLFAGLNGTDELPELWNEKYEQYLGVEVDSDSNGVMQDIHWYSHYWGYFFGYSLGDMICSQFSSALTRELKDWHHSLEQGEITPILTWLGRNIHSKGALFDTLDLVRNVSGEELKARYYKNYLNQKYLHLYDL